MVEQNKESEKKALKSELTQLKNEINKSPISRSHLITILANATSLLLQANALDLNLQISEFLQNAEEKVKDQENRLSQDRDNELKNKADLEKADLEAAAEEQRRLAELLKLTIVSKEFIECIEQERNTLHNISNLIAKGDDVPQAEIDKFVEQIKARQEKHQTINSIHQQAHECDQNFETEINSLHYVINNPDSQNHEKETARQKLPKVKKQREQHAVILKAAEKTKRVADDVVKSYLGKGNILKQHINKLPDSNPKKSKFLKCIQLIEEEPKAEVSNKILQEIKEVGDGVRSNLEYHNTIRPSKTNNKASSFKSRAGIKQKNDKGIG